MTIYDVFTNDEQVAIIFTDGAKSLVLSLKENKVWLVDGAHIANDRMKRLLWEIGPAFEIRENTNDHPNWLFGYGLGAELRDHQDRKPFHCIGGPEKRLAPEPQIPDGLPDKEEDRRYFLYGYIAGAVLRYGTDWRTVKIE